MAEVFFIATVIFVAYVVYSVTGEEKPSLKPKLKPVEKKPANTATKTEPPVSVTANDDEAKTTDEPAAHPTAGKLIRNPKTGETAAIPSNYRFTKRWIKELLVDEGLLEKVYKNNELDEESSLKVKNALQEFKKMHKYLA